MLCTMGLILKGQDFDILDCFDRDKGTDYSIEDQMDAPHQRANDFLATSNEKVIEQRDFVQSGLQSTAIKAERVYLPIYEDTMNQHFCGMDLSINCVRLSFGAMKEVLDNNIQNQNKFDVSFNIYQELRSKIECGVDNYSIQNDFDNKLLSTIN